MLNYKYLESLLKIVFDHCLVVGFIDLIIIFHVIKFRPEAKQIQRLRKKKGKIQIEKFAVTQKTYINRTKMVKQIYWHSKRHSRNINNNNKK